jgi:hypothetical protein
MKYETFTLHSFYGTIYNHEGLLAFIRLPITPQLLRIDPQGCL